MFYATITDKDGRNIHTISHNNNLTKNGVDIELNNIFVYFDELFNYHMENMEATEWIETNNNFEESFQNFCEKYQVEFTVGNITSFIGNGKDFLRTLKICSGPEISRDLVEENIVGEEQETDFQNGLVNDKFNPTY